MSITPGTRLGAYQVLGPLGAGGMGEVYLARDTKLGREIAIKVLPGPFARDPERLARFEREARLLAALNHPRLAAIYGLEHLDGVHFLVLELAAGESLAARLARGPLPLGQAVDVARQLADGLEAAHEKGIVHRDLKPGNIQIAPDGQVKILDFGLAKAFEPDPASADSSQSPTLTSGGTRHGVILGTAAYMSPEQARGQAVDKRADVWAFGGVLYECLAGRRPFPGDSVADTISAVLEREPDWSALPPDTPASVHRLLRRLTRLTWDGAMARDPALSPDGTMLAYASNRGDATNLDLWLQRVAGGTPTRLTSDPADDDEPSFAPSAGRPTAASSTCCSSRTASVASTPSRSTRRAASRPVRRSPSSTSTTRSG